MIRQMIQLIWKRKRSNIFLVAELLLTFFVLYLVCAIGLHTWNRYTSPDGFSVENVLNIGLTQININNNRGEKAPAVARAARILKDMPEVRTLGLSAWELYGRSRAYSSMTIHDRNYQIAYAFLSDGCFEALDMDVVRGRGFSSEDDGGDYAPVVINSYFAHRAFGDEDPVGQTINGKSKIVGVVSDFRMYGPFEEPMDLVIRRKPPVDFTRSDEGADPEWSGDIILKLNTPVTAELNARIINALQNAEPDWTFNITPGEDLRDACIKQQATPYLTAGVASASLIAMVVLGLFGVLWQNITARTREIGLRRAKGASIGDIHLQIVGEMLLVATVAAVPGILIVAQLIMMDVMSHIPLGTHAIALCCATAFLYLMVVACSLYPGHMATRINPAQALHYE